MIVARQFIAWENHTKNPSRRVRYDPYPGLKNRPHRGTPIGPNQTVPRLDAFQPRKFSGLATIIRSLRDEQRFCRQAKSDERKGALLLRRNRSTLLATVRAQGFSPERIHFFSRGSPNQDVKFG
jgi:hypothetical protein